MCFTLEQSSGCHEVQTQLCTPQNCHPMHMRIKVLNILATPIYGTLNVQLKTSKATYYCQLYLIPIIIGNIILDLTNLK